MKKVLLFAVVLTGAVAFTSCGSDECECTYAGQTETITEDDLPSSAEGSLEEYCDAIDALYKATGTDGSCSMK